MVCHHKHEEWEEEHEEWKCHHKPIPIRGFAHLAILKILKDKSASGSEIQKTITEKYEFEIPKPLVYGLLRRMEHMGLLTSKWDVSEPGPAKRIYTITEEGLEYLNRGMEKIEKIKKLIEKLSS